MKLTKDNYFQDEFYMSTSLWKRFNQCEELGLIPFGEPTESMLIGSYVDSHVEGTLEQFKLDNPQIIAKTGKNKGKLKVGFQKAEEICNFIDQDKKIQQFLSGEKQRIMVGEIEGVPTKIMMDDYDEFAIKDLKIMQTITNRNGEYIDFISNWGYHYQGAIYREIVRQNTGQTLPFFIVTLTKETPINSAIIQIPDEILDTALEEVKENISRYYDIWQGKIPPEGCGKCNTCISKRKETPLISLYDMMGGE